MGDLAAGRASSTTVAEIDAHVLGCHACRVFARDSYRALQVLPLPPTTAVLQRAADQMAAPLERLPEPTAAAGGAILASGAATAGGGAGLAGLLTAGGSVGGLKAVLAVCGATVVTASVCGGVAMVLHGMDPSRRPTDTEKVQRARKPTTTAQTYARRSTPATVRKRAAPQRTTTTVSSNAPVVSPAPRGSREFEPGGSNAPPQPAPAPTTGGGEFTP
jgi:hypothetical protein